MGVLRLTIAILMGGCTYNEYCSPCWGTRIHDGKPTRHNAMLRAKAAVLTGMLSNSDASSSWNAMSTATHTGMPTMSIPNTGIPAISAVAHSVMLVLNATLHTRMPTSASASQA